MEVPEPPDQCSCGRWDRRMFLTFAGEPEWVCKECVRNYMD